MILRARVVLPVGQPPIEDGAVVIRGNRIVAIGPASELPKSAERIDLGDALLLPGLVNAHCHLDYTDMAGHIPPQKSFIDWIMLMLATKAEWSYSEFAESWVRGARMLLRTGTTTVGDIEAVPELLPDVWQATPLRVISFVEMTGVRSQREPRTILRDALQTIQSLPAGRSSAGLSPHAPYSTFPELLRLAARAARDQELPLTTHVAESDQEFEMFMRGTGKMFEGLRKNGRNMADCGNTSPVQHLARQDALGNNLLAVHMNYLAPKDASLLHRKKVSVVHCPRSHAYFRHRKFPFRELTRAKVNICLGTDSLATVYKRRNDSIELSMFDEMRTFARAHSRVAKKSIVQMATVNGARALGRAGEIGELRPGALADLIAIPFDGKPSEAWNAVIEHRGDVLASLIDGEWAIAP
jgi:cytosine/adenosine deaminase-related metal-dependent hydrolase